MTNNVGRRIMPVDTFLAKQDAIPVQRRRPPGLSVDGIAITKRVGLALPPNIPIKSWERLGRQISLIVDSSSWWLGDWLVYGELTYPDRYRQALAATSLDYQTLRNYAWVARSFRLSRRRDNLSFGHHAELASLPPEEQDYWLNQAERGNWSRNRLRQQLKISREVHALERSSPQAPHAIVLAATPEQRHRWEEAADRASCDLLHWACAVLDAAARTIDGSNGSRGFGSRVEIGQRS